MIRGKINYHQWTRTLPRTGGIPVPQQVTMSNLDNLPNRVLRYCLEYLADTPLLYVSRTAILNRLDYFSQISSIDVTDEELATLTHLLESGHFPASRYYYLPALNLALLILRGAGLALGDSDDVRFKPLLINTATMFERYVRVLCQEAAQECDAHALDGKQQPMPFYTESIYPILVIPDVLIRRGGTTLLVIDAKYKFEPTVQDHYQMWSYLHAHQVRRGGFISVAGARERRSNLTWFKRDEYNVFDYALNMQGSDIKQLERDLQEFIRAQVTLVLP